ncbi:hypothetical protein C8A05DRAFT_39698, partial [Staphylotrichum tortipilum]
AGEIKVAPGEVYCRYKGSSTAMCPNASESILRESNLKGHVKKHKWNGQFVTVKSKRQGANSVDDMIAAAEFYERLQAIAEGRNAEEEEEAPPLPVLATPSKRKDAETTAPELLELPFTKARKNNPAHPKLSEMKAMLGIKKAARCALCVSAKRKICPPATRPTEDEGCNVWTKFAIHCHEPTI